MAYTSTLKQQSASRYVAPLGHIILIPSQLVCDLTRECCVLSGEATNTNFKVFGLTWGSSSRTTALEASTILITPPTRYLIL